jgi:hypothetical protein
MVIIETINTISNKGDGKNRRFLQGGERELDEDRIELGVYSQKEMNDLGLVYTGKKHSDGIYLYRKGGRFYRFKHIGTELYQLICKRTFRFIDKEGGK